MTEIEEFEGRLKRLSDVTVLWLYRGGPETGLVPEHLRGSLEKEVDRRKLIEKDAPPCGGN